MITQLTYINLSANSNNSKRAYEQKLAQCKALDGTISGLILYANGMVIQFFEGGASHVHKLFKIINPSKSNKNAGISDETPIKTRCIKQNGIQIKKVSVAEIKHLSSIYENDKIKFTQALVKIANSLNELPLKFDPEQLEYFKADTPVKQNKNVGFFEFSIETAADEVFLMKSDSQIVYVNQSACKKLGYDQQELIGMYVWEWDPLFPKEVWPGFWQESIKKKHLHFETQHRKKTGEVFPVEIHAHVFIHDNEKYLLAFVNDITERKRIEDELLKYKAKLEKRIDTTEKHIKTIFELASDGIHILDSEGNVIECNQAFANLLGYSRTEALKLNVKDWDAAIPQDQLTDFIKQLVKEPRTFQTKHKRKDGTIFDVEINAKGISLNGKIYLYASSRDITQRIKDQQEIERLAKTDQLTGLSNRHEFMQRFRQYFSMAKREHDDLALVFLDLDNFKLINDQYGHLLGDEVLIHCANILKKHCRDHDVVARFGGDEFVVLLMNTDKQAARHFAEKILTKFKTPFKRNDLIIAINLSIGISVFPENAKSMTELMQKSDMALYQSKQSGRGRYSF